MTEIPSNMSHLLFDFGWVIGYLLITYRGHGDDSDPWYKEYPQVLLWYHRSRYKKKLQFFFFNILSYTLFVRWTYLTREESLISATCSVIQWRMLPIWFSISKLLVTGERAHGIGNTCFICWHFFRFNWIATNLFKKMHFNVKSMDGWRYGIKRDNNGLQVISTFIYLANIWTINANQRYIN